MYQQVLHSEILHSAHRVCLCNFYKSQNKRRLLPIQYWPTDCFS